MNIFVFIDLLGYGVGGIGIDSSGIHLYWYMIRQY